MVKQITKRNQEPVARSRSMTAEEVEAAYGIPAGTLRYWRHCDTGPRSYTVGRRIRYDVADLDAWIAAQKATTGRGEVA